MSSVNHDDFAHLKIPHEDVISATNNFAKELHLEHQKLRKSSLNNKFAHLRIPLEYIISTTNNFADKNLKNTGGIGNRYKGQLLWSGELIDIIAQRLNKDLQYGEQMFWTEISMLSSLKHKNLVSLVGFCDENDEKIIITRYDTRGILSEYLSDPMLLTWERRLKICVGVAHALSYIHYDEQRDFSLIHRCVCSATVRVNDDWEPTLSDFQVSMKIKASQRHHSFHTNNLEYFNGYGDPAYIETNSVSHKSDIYSFGIVLFELLCGREAVTNVDQDNKYFASVAVTHCREKKLNEIIDWDLRNQMDSQSFNIFAETAYDSLNEKQSQRPNIEEIVTRLEKALELQLEYQKAKELEDAKKTTQESGENVPEIEILAKVLGTRSGYIPSLGRKLKGVSSSSSAKSSSSSYYRASKTYTQEEMDEKTKIMKKSIRKQVVASVNKKFEKLLAQLAGKGISLDKDDVVGEEDEEYEESDDDGMENEDDGMENEDDDGMQNEDE